MSGKTDFGSRLWFEFKAEFGVWSLEFGVWSLEFGVWSLEFGVWMLTLFYRSVAGSQKISLKFWI